MPPETALRLQARDVVAFGREVGRVLSDGRIVGRAEPFAKVFASSREVKRAVGATAWVILEDLALDATIDDYGRLVADTSVRHIAANLGLNKSTVTRHVARLRDHGFVLHEETRDDASGRWHASRYVLDPRRVSSGSPTHRPPNRHRRRRLSSSTSRSTGQPPPCPHLPDTVPPECDTKGARCEWISSVGGSAVVSKMGSQASV